ncbi:MAG: ribose 5-phosphate isomerase B [Bacteroidota bacterium]
MKISIGSDHAGFEYKTSIISFLQELNHQVKDQGTANTDSCDYPDYAHPVANDVENKEADFGVLICGSANGVAMTANKHQAIRAAIAWNREISELARHHNDANIICIPARYITIEEAKEIVYAFLATDFDGGRHLKRVEKIAIL